MRVLARLYKLRIIAGMFLLTLLANQSFANGKNFSGFYTSVLLDNLGSSSIELGDEVRNTILLLLIPIVVAFAFFVFIFYRSRREALIKKSFAELEMKALRAQMNPHFMFNCLNSIHKFMNTNDVNKASDYLIRFSKLMRMVLENSNYKEVSLAKDMASLELYIQMEQMRYSHNFDYEIKVDTGIDAENTAIPPLILQPFVENAILHGLHNRTDKGKLELTIERHREYVKYCIIDNGQKRVDEESKKSSLDVFKKKSMGSGLTSERIDLLNRSKGLKGYFSSVDINGANNEYAGRKVEIMLPFEELN